jgi:putative nucleotidyltransferase with HDIG domain
MDRKKAKKLLKEFCTPSHIIKHCEMVAFVAGKIANFLKKQGEKVDVELVVIAGLLHDLLRIVDINGDAYDALCEQYPEENKKIWDKQKLLYKGMSHSDAVAKYLNKMGEPILAEIIRKHRFDAIIEPKEQPFTIEEKILTYADKRVLYADIVSLKERLEDGHKRYNPHNENPEREKKAHDAYFQLDKEFSTALV